MAKNCAKIGVNLRVTETGHQGGRKHMEDTYAVHFERNPNTGQAEFAYFAIFDGHGGGEASNFAKNHLLAEIIKYESFWRSNDDNQVMEAIKLGFLDTHKLMAKELDKWPKTLSGFPSTSGTTASIAIIKHSKLYIGHVGDSGVALGFQGEHSDIHALMLTKDHKPECPEERKRIEDCGGEVVTKAGVQRVVWNRPKLTHKGPIRRSTVTDKIPFLAVARSLGDLWSFNYAYGDFIISPMPDVSVHNLLPKNDKCLILGSDGLWNMMTPLEAVMVVLEDEQKFDELVVNDILSPLTYWNNPAEHLVNFALQKWHERMLKADNTTCVVVMIDTMGPSKLERLRRRREEHIQQLNKQHKLSMDINAYLKQHLLPNANNGQCHAPVLTATPITAGQIQVKVQGENLPLENDRTKVNSLLLNTSNVDINDCRSDSETNPSLDHNSITESSENNNLNASPSSIGDTSSDGDITPEISICKEPENLSAGKLYRTSRMRFSLCLSGEEDDESSDLGSDGSRCAETGEIDHNANICDDTAPSENKETTAVKSKDFSLSSLSVSTSPLVQRRLSLRPNLLRTRTHKIDDKLCKSRLSDKVTLKEKVTPNKTILSRGKLDFKEKLTKRFFSSHLFDTQNISESSGSHLRSANSTQNQHSHSNISEEISSQKLSEMATRSKRKTNSVPNRTLSLNCMQFPTSKEKKCNSEKRHVLKRFLAWQQQLIGDHKSSKPHHRNSKRKHDSGETSAENVCIKRSCKFNLRFSHTPLRKEQSSSSIKVDG
ncbi:protein phosphatase 1D [Octopus vulgaris]|uniref:Protein phosphatase 1D n=2 Tax=Octopus TaxID=6643 RepID=A0AA36AGV9_OCTVU|nr:uncharacterized protein LOC115211096 [Octopus sinensis]CAI9715921.1 protein phosphatase 1D [Octopus vulgaris]